MCLHKEGFDALVHRRVEDTTNKFELIHQDLLSNFSELRQRPSNKTLQHATNMKEYKELVTAVSSTTTTRLQMMVNYVKDILTRLPIVSAILTENITPDLQTERKMLKLFFCT